MGDTTEQSVELRTELGQIANRLQVRLTRAAEEVIQIGLDLCRAKEILPHGGFSKWLEQEFELSQRTATQFMRTAERFGTKPETVAALPGGVILELGSPRVPDSLVDGVIDGTIPATVTSVRERLRGHGRTMIGQRAARDLMGEFWRLPDMPNEAADVLVEAIFDAAEADGSETFFDWILATLQLTLDQLREAAE